MRKVSSYSSASVDIRQRALAYLKRCTPAILGAGGDAQTFSVARAIVWGFDLGPEEGFDLTQKLAHATPSENKEP